MPRKKIEVVELNKKEEKIVLEEKQSALTLFWRRHRLLIFLTLLLVSSSVLGVSIMLTIKNINQSKEPTIKEVSIDTSLDEYKASVITGDNSLTEDTAKDAFLKNGLFKNNGEVILTKTVENDKFTIYFYSDGTAIKVMKNMNLVTRINALPNGEYGINEKGIINSKAITSEVRVKETKEYPWGLVTYYSDGSASISNSNMDIFVRNANDINDNYISNNKVTYLKETKTVGNIKLNYYYDGTIEVIKNNKSYLARNSEDLNITSNDVTFKNNNQSEIYKTETMKDGTIINYYTDGGAIIHKDNQTLSVRKSNSIVIKDNKIYEIVDNIYVEISKQANGVTYYTNGGAVVNYHGQTYYVDENSNIKYQNGNISSIGNNAEKLSQETSMYGENVKMFDKTAVITTDKYIAIVPKDKVIFDSTGKIKEIETELEDTKNSFKIVNNTNEKLRYRVVIERSPRTNLDTQYIRYQLLTNGEYVGPKKLNDSIWKADDLSKELKLKNTNYILIDSTIEPYATENISIMLWTDYDTIPNAMQNKYFYGTIRVYAWSEKK